MCDSIAKWILTHLAQISNKIKKKNFLSKKHTSKWASIAINHKFTFALT